jgi:hypothetical protein
MDRATAPSPAAPRRRGEAARAAVLGALIAGSACALNQQGVDPPADTFFYPASAIQDPSANWLFVTNSNADLRYNDGTLVVVDLVSASADRAQGGGPVPVSGGPVLGLTGPLQSWGLCAQEDFVNPLPRSDPQICCWDRLDANILNCDERRYVQPDATVRIGSFAAGMAWQDYCSGPCDKGAPECASPVANRGRLLIGVRGDTSLTWVDVIPAAGTHPSFSCGQPNVSLGECGAGSRILDTTSALVTETDPELDTNAPLVPVPDEPYALALDAPLGMLYVGHLVGSTATVDTGGVSLFDVSFTTQPLGMTNFLSPFPSPFPPNSAGAFGITALDLHVPLGQPPGPGHEIFASSRYVPLITSMGPFGTLTGCPLSASDIVVEPAGESFNSGLIGSEMRGVQFIEPPPPDPSAPPPDPSLPPPYAQRAYALERVPPDLVGFDINKNNAGATITTPTDVSETCSSPTFLYQHQVTAAEGTRLYVNCFDTGEIYVFDPAVPTLLTTFQVGRGPAGLVFPDPSSPMAYLIGFSDNNISVLDLAPGSQTQYHVIQRLGFPSVTPR